MALYRCKQIRAHRARGSNQPRFQNSEGRRIFKFAALVCCRRRQRHGGFGLGKAGEVPDAIRKGIEDAKKNLHKISLKGTTIPHEIIGVYGAGRVLMKPAPQGTGVIAGGLCVQCWRLQESGISVRNPFVPITPATLSAQPFRDCVLCVMPSR